MLIVFLFRQNESQQRFGFKKFFKFADLSSILNVKSPVKIANAL